MTDSAYRSIKKFMSAVRPDLFPTEYDAAKIIWKLADEIPVGESAAYGGFRFERTDEGMEVSLAIGYVEHSFDSDGDWTWIGTELEELFKLKTG